MASRIDRVARRDPSGVVCVWAWSDLGAGKVRNRRYAPATWSKIV